MAEIVILERWREGQRRRPEIRIGGKAGEGAGQLLLFTGIRYERLEQLPLQRNQLMVLEQNQT
ncbi:hypothetical protein REJC140_02527 [Pseudorhizobium endolithicum]|uniref:Transposase n=1 Tax=Pseudorhizobium endolithicum TaxID=1191678 RepID=A0ABN7JJW3_9HYPH|nr:hypothetical protein [Pseudorhizobium endolithicum]CAD6421387.1 hypothetical protein REQ54_02221 [Rhizobium sp. Q54]CAD7027646.1 hypothetical protein REJC140_02527 [Pseudorhizobium endolithicum]